MPAAPGDRHTRNDELIQGGSKTIFEFDGRHAESGGRTFAPGDFEFDGSAERTPSNLSSGGGGTWMLVGVGALVVAGLLAWHFTRDTGAVEEPAAEAEVAAPAEAPAEAEPAAAESEGESGADTDDAKAEEAKAEEAKAEEAKEPEPKAEPKPKTESKPKPKPKTESKPKPRPKPKPKAEPKPKPKPKSVKSLKPSKPPREDEGFGNLPKPP
jgi:hypothetical protein